MQDTDLALLIDRFMRTIHHELQARASGFDGEAVGPGGGIVLMTLADMTLADTTLVDMTLAESGRISLNELTRKVARDKSQMTRMIRSLEAKGLVGREASPDDGRVSLVFLTPKGQGIARDLMGAVAEVINDILSPISADEKRMLKDILARVG